jgi:hypothetical protein
MDKDECTSGPRCHKVGADHGFPDTGRRNEDTDSVLQERPSSPFLDGSQLTPEMEVEPLALLTSIIDDQATAGAVE